MQAIKLAQNNLQIQKAHPIPQPEAGEALIKVTVAGICATDLEMIKGYKSGFQGILGHEFVGVVEQAPDSAWLGKRVVGSINIGCNNCATCRQQGAEHCPNRRVLGIHNKDGAFADYLTLPQSNLFVVPDDVADETAVFTEPLAAALRIREQIRLIPGSKTAVLGPGRLGILVGQVLALDGTDVIMIGRSRRSLALPQKLGLATSLTEEFAENSFDTVVETTGNEAGFALALKLIRPLGTLVLKSTFAGQSNLDLTKLVVAEINVVGSRCGPFAPALTLLQRHAVDVTSLIDGEYNFSHAIQAFTHASQHGVRKILLRP
ncbi:MAG: alcohol dehydrogenase catalytic domain-containing protein [Anaerolineae bacterium]|nr:alcohol dehydrogenase catalytic domain-containing protein [Anaerolineae bacterium]